MKSWSSLASLLTVSLAITAAMAVPAHAAMSPAALRDTLIAAAPAGSAAHVDPATGKVVLRLAASFSHPLLARHAAQIRVEHGAAVRPLEYLYGGQGIVGTHASPDERCSSGFIASDGTENYVISAGHCTTKSTRWERKGNLLGTRAAHSVYGEDGDFGIILEHGVSFVPVAAVKSPYGILSIVGTEPAFVGQEVCKMGNNTGYTCGVVTEVDASVNYPGGIIVNGMIATTVCAEKGDSGGPLMTEFRIGPTYYAFGVGVLSGGSGSCSSGTALTYHQPLDEILQYHGLNLWTVS